MAKYTLKQVNDMSLSQALIVTGDPDFELVPSTVSGEDAEIREALNRDLEELKWKLGGPA